MRRFNRRILARLAALLASPVMFIQVGTCDSQFPPPNTRCRLGVCIAEEQVVTVEAPEAE